MSTAVKDDKKTTALQPLHTRFTIAVDSREQHPYTFEGLTADAKNNHRPLAVRREWKGIPTGDYSILGMEDRVCVERKSLADLYSTLGSGRERFEREHERMARMAAAFVVIEADWDMILTSPPKHSQLRPKAVFRTAISWMQRYHVPWLAMGSRRLAEVTTFRILDKFYHEQMAKGEA